MARLIREGHSEPEHTRCHGNTSLGIRLTYTSPVSLEISRLTNNNFGVNLNYDTFIAGVFSTVVMVSVY